MKRLIKLPEYTEKNLADLISYMDKIDPKMSYSPNDSKGKNGFRFELPSYSGRIYYSISSRNEIRAVLEAKKEDIEEFLKVAEIK